MIPFDVGEQILTRAVSRTAGLAAVVADGAAMPFRDMCADTLCFAQSWHWLDERSRCQEAARVLRPGGRWAGWWSHARADGQEWFDRAWDAIESATVARRSHRDIDWGDGLRQSRLFNVGERMRLRWVRLVTVDQWIIDERSKSYIAALPEADRSTLLRTLEGAILEAFPDRRMHVPYETWMWIATTRSM